MGRTPVVQSATMGAKHPPEGPSGPEPGEPTGHPEGCFLDCPTCERLRRAAVEIAVRDGIDRTTTAAVAERAGIPVEQAMGHYPTAEDCLAAAYDEAALMLRRVCARTLQGEGTWRDRLGTAIDTALEAFNERPALGRYYFVEAWYSTLPMLSASRVADRERLVRILAEHSEPASRGEDLPELRFEVMVGAAHHAVREQLDGHGGDVTLRERLDRLIDLFEHPAGVR
jgi:AcrR family transcriptional regulator